MPMVSLRPWLRSTGVGHWRFPNAVLFAHDGRVTWDEWLFVLIPLALFAVVIWRAKLRAEREHERDHEPSDP